MFRHVQKREHITLFSPCNFFPLFLLSFSGKVKCKISVDSSTLHRNSLIGFMFSLVHKYFPIAKNGVYFYIYRHTYCTVHSPPDSGYQQIKLACSKSAKIKIFS